MCVCVCVGVESMHAHHHLHPPTFPHFTTYTTTPHAPQPLLSPLHYTPTTHPLHTHYIPTTHPRHTHYTPITTPPSPLHTCCHVSPLPTSSAGMDSTILHTSSVARTTTGYTTGTNQGPPAQLPSMSCSNTAGDLPWVCYRLGSHTHYTRVRHFTPLKYTLTHTHTHMLGIPPLSF